MRIILKDIIMVIVLGSHSVNPSLILGTKKEDNGKGNN